MKSKRFITFTLGACLVLSLASCRTIDSSTNTEGNSTENNDEENQDNNGGSTQEDTGGNTENDSTVPEGYVKETLELVDLTEGQFNLPGPNPGFDTYFLKNGSVPNIGIKEFVSSLEGFFKKDFLTYDINNETEIATLSYKNNPSTKLVINCKEDTIKTNVNDFFNFKEHEPSGNAHKKLESVSYNHVDSPEVIYDLKKYGFDTFIADKDVVVPFNILNTIAITPNIAGILFNGDSYFLYPGYLGENTVARNLIKNERLEGTEIPDDVLEARNNGLYFTLDYFYGLKDELHITSFKDFVESKPDIKTLLNSPYPADTHKALSKLLIGEFDDPHTTLKMYSFYKKAATPEEYIMTRFDEDTKTRNTRMDATYEFMEGKLNEAYKAGHMTEGNPVNSADGVTAFIKFDDFKIADDSLLFDDNGNLLDTAYQHDTFYLFKQCLELLDNFEGQTFKNVVIDLSMNGGGVLDQAHNAAGFLTDKLVSTPTTNLVNKQNKVEDWRVDTNGDKNFTDKDSYEGKYNFFVLTSDFTFSAANYFTALCKDMGLATILGERSGGGQCAVYEPSLLDGTTFGMSSPYVLRGADYSNPTNPTFYSIENGVEPDLAIDRNLYYNLPELTNIINEHFPLE